MTEFEFGCWIQQEIERDAQDEQVIGFIVWGDTYCKAHFPTGREDHYDGPIRRGDSWYAPYPTCADCLTEIRVTLDYGIVFTRQSVA